MKTIADFAVERAANEAGVDRNRTIYIMGGRGAIKNKTGQGKTTLVHGFLELSEPVHETLAVEYSFGRRRVRGEAGAGGRAVCHLWQLGGRPELVARALKTLPHTDGDSTAFIVVDLGRPASMWHALEICLTELALRPDVEKVIIGAKYDLFKNFDSETKKSIGVALRGLGIIFNASIFFYSSKEQSLIRRISGIFNHYGFNEGNISREKSTSVNRPMWVITGTDSWESLGLRELSFDAVKLNFKTQFKQELELDLLADGIVGDGFSSTAHPEPVFDAILKQRYDGIEIHET